MLSLYSSSLFAFSRRVGAGHAFPTQPFGNLQTKPIQNRRKNVMAQTVICSICKKELEGVIEVIRRSPGRIRVALFRETSDCNWTQCKSCKTLICKECSAGSPHLCCEGAHSGDTQEALTAKSE